MAANLQIPEALAHRLEALAEEEGIFPVISPEESGNVIPATGAELDAMFAGD